jgi:hypothetical protein
MIMRRVKAFGAFWYDFVIGDDWLVALGVVVALAATYLLAHRTHIAAWWVVPVALLVLLRGASGASCAPAADQRGQALRRNHALPCGRTPSDPRHASGPVRPAQTGRRRVGRMGIIGWPCRRPERSRPELPARRRRWAAQGYRP